MFQTLYSQAFSVRYLLCYFFQQHFKNIKPIFQLSSCTETGHRLDLVQFADRETLSKIFEQSLDMIRVHLRKMAEVGENHLTYPSYLDFLSSRENMFYKLNWKGQSCIFSGSVYRAGIHIITEKITVYKFFRITFSLHLPPSCWLQLAS